MRINYFFRNGFLIPRIAAALVLVSGAVALTFLAFAANPPSGTLSAATPILTYSTGPNVQSNPSAQAMLICNAALPCDDFLLTVDATGFVGTHNIVISVQWPVPAEDYDLYVHQGQNPPGALLKTAASSADPEIAIIDAVSGVYTIRVVPFAVAGSTFTGTIEFVEKPTSPEPVPPGPGTPRYHNFAATGPLGNSAGEPTLGPGPAILGPPGGRTMFIAGLETLRTTWNDCSSPASGPGFPGTPANFPPLWEDKSFATTSVTSLDPILHTDFVTGRTFVSQLGPKTSFLAFTDNDGGEDPDTSNDYTPSQGSGLNSGVDHQNIGAGPYNDNAVPAPPPHPTYPNAVYYASQDAAIAQMARSDTGGLTFGAAVPMYNLTQCGGLHGHLKVTPSNAVTIANGHAGTVYLPNKGCGTTQGVVVSEDNGLTFVIRTIPGSSPGDTDPSLGIDAAGKIYFAFADGDGHAKVAVSSNKGSTWSTPVDVGAPFSIRNTVFPGAVGGDADRATVMYLATDTGNIPFGYEAIGQFTGVWHIYASHTFDGGATWTTVRVSPANDPVQRGSICTSGTTCGADRNLLDFNDVEIDHEGRVIIAYADGCIGCTSPTGNDSRAAKATIARQSGGRRMIAAFDPSPPEPKAPASPRVNQVGEVFPGNVHLAWSEPDNGGSPLTGYNVYRRLDPGVYGAPLATVTLNCPACKTTYDDTTAVPDTAYFYKVTAINAIGQGTNCGEFPIGPVIGGGDPCVLPGVEVVEDPIGDTTGGPNPQRDIESLSFAELYDAANPNNKLYITLRVGDLNPVPLPETRWTTFFTRVNPPGSPPEWGASTEWFVAMVTDDTGSPGTPVYRYGHTFIDPNPPNLRNLVTDGTADSGSNSVDGTILITISTPTRTNMTASGRNFPLLQTGESLTNVNSITQQSAGVLLATIDMTGNGSYTLEGNASCRPNTAPIAVLRANPLTGPEPLLVSFNGALSHDPDTDPPPDTIASYTFNFGDGSPEVTQASPMIQHIYVEDGNYQASLRVVDSRGKPSDNPALVQIQVTATNQTPTPTPSGTPTPPPTPTPSPTPTQTPGPTVTPTPTPDCTPTGSFSDDFEPAANPGWTVNTDINLTPASLPWTVLADGTAHSATNSYKTDASTLDEKDDRLIAPPQSLSSTSHLIFWHRFNTESTFDGGVLEISTNGGASWVDVLAGGGVFVSGAYNDVIDTGFNSRIAGRAAWTGLSDFPNAMNIVDVNLGAFAGPNRLIRWRYVGDPFLPGSIPGESWAIDDVQFTNTCGPAATPTPTATVSASPPATPTATPSATATPPPATPTPTPPAPTPTPTSTPPAPTPTPTPTPPPATPTPPPATPTPTPPAPTPTPTSTPPAPTPTPTPTPPPATPTPPPATPTPTPATPTPTPATPTPPPVTPTPTPATPTPTPATPTPTPATPTPTPATPTPTPATPTPTPATPTPTPTPTPSVTPSPSPSPTCIPAASPQVVPPAYTSTPGTGVFIGPLANAQRTYQLLINQNQLTGMVGRQITALTWRLPTSATGPWPPADATFSNYDIRLSGSVAPADRSLTFAANVVGPQTLVRSGSLDIPASSYPSGGSPNAFGPAITFDIPWLYTGGHLLIELRHNGSTGTSRSTDALLTSTSGYGTDFSAAWTGSYTGTTGAQGNFSIAQLMTDGACPGASPTPTPTPTPATPTPTPTVTPSTPTPTPTVTPATPTPTVTPATPTPSPTLTPATPPPTPTVTPSTPTPTPTPTIPPSPTATPTATSTPTSTPSATATATATPSPPAAQTINLSTRMRVQTGDNVGIGGFIISGSAPKHVLLRAIGPSLTQFGVPNALADPVLELHGPGTFTTVNNDNWQDDPAQAAAILATGLAPTNNQESAIDATLNPGAYTAVVRGKNNSTGVALVEVFDVNQAVPSKLANISTRAVVSIGDDIVIAGFILGNNSGNDRIVARGIGPSLAAFGVSPVLANPTLELRNNNGTLLFSNNDWQDNPAQAAELMAAGLAPTNALESGIAATLPPGLYTALLAGLNNGTGIGLVEVYDRGGGP